MPEYFIEIEQRRTGDGRELYAVWMGQSMRRKTAKQGDGLCAVHKPADTCAEAVEKAKETLEKYNNPWWRQEDRPAPTADNTELRDETGEFTMADFFEKGTLAAYM